MQNDRFAEHSSVLGIGWPLVPASVLCTFALLLSGLAMFAVDTGAPARAKDIARRSAMKPKNPVSSLRSAELFEGLSPSDSQTILSTSSEKVFYPRQQIFQEGEPMQKIFLLKEGLAKVSQLSRKGDETILWLNVRGEVIGSMTSLSDSQHSSSALAVRSCKVMTWRLPAFEGILGRFPLLLRNVQHILTRQIAELSSRICELSTASVEIRLAHALISLTDKIGRNVDGHFEVDLTQETLALMIGTTLYYVCHLLSAWERQRLVVSQRRCIVIRDLAGLKGLCARIHRPAYAKVDPALHHTLGAVPARQEVDSDFARRKSNWTRKSDMTQTTVC